MIIVLEKWVASPYKTPQRLIYDAEQDQIIHQYRHEGDLFWQTDTCTNNPHSTDVAYFNEYLDMDNRERVKEQIKGMRLTIQNTPIWDCTRELDELCRLATIGAEKENTP